MVAVASRLGARVRGRAGSHDGLVAAAGLLLLMGASVLLLRTGQLGTGYWIDEGLSVGIADRPLTAIPGVLRLDGSPPAYYMLLHVWMALTGGQGPRMTHWLSIAVATAAVPATWALVRPLLGQRTAWIAAVLVAGVPFLTQYAQESRMYALVVALSLISSACFAGAFALRRGRRWVVGFAVAQAALLYTHNWGWFLGAGLAAGWVALIVVGPRTERRGLVRDGLLAALVLAVLLAPWLPTLAFQAAHTGAPWANPPGFDQLYLAPQQLLGTTAFYVLVLGAGAGLVAVWQTGRRGGTARAALAWAVALLVALALPWVVSQVSPAWAYRYTAVGVGPLVLLAAALLGRAGGLGIAAIVVCCAVWLGSDPAPAAKSNVSAVALRVRPALAPGDLVISTQPEQIPVLHHYWRRVGDLRWATLWGRVSDTGVTDWRDGVAHLRATSPRRDLTPLLDRVPAGARVALVQPITANLARWRAPWTALVRQRSAAWETTMRRDPRFKLIAQVPPSASTRLPNSVQVGLWVRTSGR